MKNLTKNCQKIINLLGDHPQEIFFTKEIADLLKISLGGAHNALKYLIKEKIVEAEQKGNMKFYRIAENNPFVRQFRIAAAIDRLTPMIEEIKNNAAEIVLFGSASRGEQTAESDIDIFVLSHEPKIIKKIILKYQNKILIKAVIKTPNEWGELEIKEPEFYNEVKQGIKLFQS